MVQLARHALKTRWFRARGGLLCVACIAVFAGGVVLWLQTTDQASLRGQLTRWQFWILELQFVLVGLTTWLAAPAFLRFLRLPRRAIVTVLGTSLLALVLTTMVAPHTNRIFYDEHIYQGVGQNLSDLHLAQMCNDGRVEYGRLECARGEYNKEPYGYPYVLSVVYRVLGVHDWIAHGVNAVGNALFVWVAFLLTSALFSDLRAGMVAGLVAALIPQQLLWAHTASAEPSAALMSAVAVLATVAFVRIRTTQMLLWAVTATVFAMQFRPESALLVPLVLSIVAFYAADEFRQARFWWACLLGLVLSTVYLGHMFTVRNETWGAASAPMSLEYLVSNLTVNGGFYVGDPRFPVLYSVLAMIGLVGRPGRASVVAALYFLLFWGVFLVFYAGSYNYGADVRFSLMTHPALVVLAGVGVSTICTVAARWTANTSRVARVCGVGLCVQFLWYMPQVRATGEEAWAARADVDFAHEVIRELPENAVVLTHNPSIFLLRGVNAAQMSLVTNGRLATEFAARYAGGVFLHWNFWCNVNDPVQVAFCENVRDGYQSELFREYRERDYRYAFYRVTVPTFSLLPR